MKESNFLAALKQKYKLQFVEPSDEICKSYLEKAENCLKSAKLLFRNELYENSISMSYYAMYDSLTALLFKFGIKCENHSGSILLLQKLFDRKDLSDTMSFAKKQRIDKQYYVGSKEDVKLIKDDTETMIKKAEEFIIQIRLIIEKLSLTEIKTARNKFKRRI